MAKTFLFPALCAVFLLVNCSSSIRSTYPQQLPYEQAPAAADQSAVHDKILRLERTHEKMKRSPVQSVQKYEEAFDDAEVGGYLDNPTPAYISELQESNGSPRGSGKSIAAMQQLAPMAQMKQKGPTRPERLITYDASLTTRSPRPDSVIERAIFLTGVVKGYVEARSNASVTLRIPSALFDTVFNALLKIGEIVDFRKSAEDITDAFQDANLRIQILNKTIQRYLKLVNQVKDESEKLKLLKEIETLREELENLEVQKKTLALRAQFAKIIFSVVAVAPRAQLSMNQEIRGFEWVHLLDPFNTRSLGKVLQYAVPAGMVRIKGNDFWLVESADGTKVWSSKLRNKPEGSATFWRDAIRQRLIGEYNTMDTSNSQGYEFIRFTPYPGSQYVYCVGVSVQNGYIQLVQAYFPDEKQEKRYFQAIRDILGRRRS